MNQYGVYGIISNYSGSGITERDIKLPKELNKMIELAERLATDIPFVRVDFYDANGHIYFGEMTFYPASGFGKFIPEEWDYKLGEWLNLSAKK